MAARANPYFDIAMPAPKPAPPAPVNALAQLERMHAEAVETARLANLLGRSLHATIALATFGVLVVAAAGAGAAATMAWAILIGGGVFAMARVYRGAIAQPFERAALHAFAQDMNAFLLYAGFAWGAGAFLALPQAIPSGGALLFAAAPAAALAALLRERQPVLLFLAPVAALTSLACVMRPFGDGALEAGLVLAACAIVAVPLQIVSRAGAKHGRAVLPRALIAS